MTITEFGALVGIATAAFVLLDRFAFGRPIISLRKADHGRDLHCINSSKHDLLITSIRAWPAWARPAHSDSLDGIVSAAAGMGFVAVLAPGAERGFPLVIARGELLDEDRKDLAPFVIAVNWRKTRSSWLPQIPVLMVSSARTLRWIEAAR